MKESLSRYFLLLLYFPVVDLVDSLVSFIFCMAAIIMLLSNMNWVTFIILFLRTLYCRIRMESRSFTKTLVRRLQKVFKDGVIWLCPIRVGECGGFNVVVGVLQHEAEKLVFHSRYDFKFVHRLRWHQMIGFCSRVVVENYVLAFFVDLGFRRLLEGFWKEFYFTNYLVKSKDLNYRLNLENNNKKKVLPFIFFKNDFCLRVSLMPFGL